MKHLPTAIRITLFIALMAFLVRPEWFEPLLSPLTQANAPAIYNRGSLLGLAAQHLATVAIATFCATFIAVGMAILVTRESGSEFLPFARSVVNIGQTFPPVAVLALAVPAVGFGEKPTLIALFLYALLPIFENTLAALTTLPRDVTEAARGVGMTPLQRLMRIELPLSVPLILAGIRISVVISLATATIGSTVAARTLGEVIIAGLLSNNLAFILQGGVVVAVMAILIHDALLAIERTFSRTHTVS
jgi:osmoprotectant transport system permease protein